MRIGVYDSRDDLSGKVFSLRVHHFRPSTVVSEARQSRAPASPAARTARLSLSAEAGPKENSRLCGAVFPQGRPAASVSGLLHFLATSSSGNGKALTSA
jgi:hypothetical protein